MSIFCIVYIIKENKITELNNKGHLKYALFYKHCLFPQNNKIHLGDDVLLPSLDKNYCYKWVVPKFIEGGQNLLNFIN